MTFVAPSFVSDATTLRTPGYSDRVAMSVFRGAVVCSGDVTANPANDTAVVSITVTGGSISDARNGQEVVFYNSNGDFKLRTHLRIGAAITSVLLPIRELSYGTAQIVSGDTFTVLNEYRLHDRLVAANAQFDPDLQPYSSAGDPGLHPAPQCNSGGHWAGQVDDGQPYATVPMTGSFSFTVDPASSGSLTHLWTLPTGVVFQSGSSSSDTDPVLQVDQGSYLVQHDVTDDTNSITSTQYIALQCADLDHPPYQVFLTSPLQADENYVWHYTARLFNDATLTDIPDGSLVVLWTRERINNQWQSIRNATPGRETILAVGYLYADKSTLDAPLNTVTFDVISPLQRLDEVAGYSKVMEESATPDAWSKIKTLTTSRAMIQLLAYYTTLSLAGFDVLFDATCNNYTYPELYLQRSTPLQQVRELCHGVDARFIADRTGMFNIHTHPKYVPLADRTGITVIFDIAKRDIIHAEFSRSHYNTTELMKTSGFSSGTSPAPLFSLYPGVAPGEAVNAPTVDRLICAAGSSGQGDLNERTGRYGADIDQVFIDANGAWHRAFTLTLILEPQYDFFDFYLSYITLTLDGSSNLRGVDLSAFHYWVKSTQITYNAQGYPQLQVVLQAETSAPSGTSYFPPDTSQNYLPPITVPSLPPLTTLPTTAPILKPTGQLPISFSIMSAHEALFEISVSFDPVSGAITYYDASTGLTGAGIDANYDPFNYFRCFTITEDGLFRNEDPVASASWTLVANWATMLGNSSYRGYKIGLSINKKGYLYIPSGNNTLAVSFNYGLTWTQVVIDGGTPSWASTAGRQVNGDVALSPWNSASNGVLYAVTPDSADGTPFVYVYKSTDWGLTWTRIYAGGSVGVADTPKWNLWIPYIRVDGVTPNKNDANQEIGLIGRGRNFAIYYSTDAGVSWAELVGTDDTVTVGSVYASVAPIGSGVIAYTWNGSIRYYVGAEGSQDAGHILKTTDHNASNTTAGTDVVAIGGFSNQGSNMGLNTWGGDPNPLIYWCRTTTDFGVSVDGATFFGTLPTDFSGGAANAQFLVSPFIPGRG